MGHGRKISGGKYKRFAKKRKYELPGITRKVKLGKTKQKTLRGLGGNIRTVLLSSEFANVLDPTTKKTKKSLDQNQTKALDLLSVLRTFLVPKV